MDRRKDGAWLPLHFGVIIDRWLEGVGVPGGRTVGVVQGWTIGERTPSSADAQIMMISCFKLWPDWRSSARR